jgi:drug/metabolite transporter (DMT)-like permease
MDETAYALVAISTLSHAYWNYVLKRANGGAAFVGLSKVVEVVVFAPLFVIALAQVSAPIPGAGLLITVGALLVLINYAALSRAYALADLSIVYPISRAATLVVLPLFGLLAFGERLSALGAVAVGLIIVGIAVMQLPSLTRSGMASLIPQLRSAGVAFAFVAALAAAAYTVWDKRAVQSMPAFVYFYGYTVFVALAYAGFLLRKDGTRALATEWRAKRWPIVQVGVLNTVTYMLVLIALRAGTSSYVIAVRQLSIAWGVLLGAWKLGETIGMPRRVGLTMLLAGCILVAMSK